mgnify:FL=1
MVASTLPKDNGVLLRNVGWDNTGERVPEDQSKRSLSELSAPKIKHYSAGKLFLCTGPYEFDHTTYEGHYNEGITFTSRPSALKFSYTYSPTNGDKGFVKIEVLDEDNNVIGQGNKTFEEQASISIASVPIKYTNTQKKAAKLKIMFASSASCSYNQKEEDSWIKSFTIDRNAEAIRTGSEFFIANVSLFYD